MAKERMIGEQAADRDMSTPDQVDVEQMQTGDPGRVQNSDMQRMRTAGDPGRTPLTAEGDEQVIDEDIKQKEALDQL